MMYRTRYIPQWDRWVAEKRIFFFLWFDVDEFANYETRVEAYEAIKRHHNYKQKVKSSDPQTIYYNL